MKAKELMEKDEKALNKLMAETQAKLVKDRFAIAGREMTNVAEVNKFRKLIAKIKTILRQKEILAIEKIAKKEVEKRTKPSSAEASDGKGEK